MTKDNVIIKLIITLFAVLVLETAAGVVREKNTVGWLEEQRSERGVYGWMRNHEKNLLSLINPSLDVVYCSTILLNHYIIRFIRFVL